MTDQVLEADVDIMRDVYMTIAQREAYVRILEAAQRPRHAMPAGMALVPVEPSPQALGILWAACTGADWAHGAMTLSRRQLARARRAWDAILALDPAVRDRAAAPAVKQPKPGPGPRGSRVDFERWAAAQPSVPEIAEIVTRFSASIATAYVWRDRWARANGIEVPKKRMGRPRKSP